MIKHYNISKKSIQLHILLMQFDIYSLNITVHICIGFINLFMCIIEEVKFNL